jgi:hypothetical protein
MGRRTMLLAAAVICAIVLALAFVVAPRSCEGGLTLYFWSGMAALLLLIALPFVAHAGPSLPARLLWSLGLALGGVAAWFAGLFLANVQIMCRLF